MDIEAVVHDKKDIGRVDRRGRPRGNSKYEKIGEIVVAWVNSEDFKTGVLELPLEGGDLRQAIINLRTNSAFKRATADVAGMFKICANKEGTAALFVAKGV